MSIDFASRASQIAALRAASGGATFLAGGATQVAGVVDNPKVAGVVTTNSGDLPVAAAAAKNFGQQAGDFAIAAGKVILDEGARVGVRKVSGMIGDGISSFGKPTTPTTN